jgi:hypothetical protein
MNARSQASGTLGGGSHRSASIADDGPQFLDLGEIRSARGEFVEQRQGRIVIAEP